MTKLPDTEKLTINMALMDLARIDLLVHENFYTNRTDFIRTAVRNLLTSQSDSIAHVVSRNSMALGLQEYTRKDLEAARRAGKMFRIRIVGLARIAADVSPALAAATIESVSVLGAFEASAAVKAILADRTNL